MINAESVKNTSLKQSRLENTSLEQSRLDEDLKKTLEDIEFVKGLKRSEPDRKFDRPGEFYSKINYLSEDVPKGYMYGKYDNCFLFLYNRPFIFTKVLLYIEKMHEDYGYMCPITPSVMAKKLKVPLDTISNVIHTLQRCNVLFIYPHNMMLIYRLFITKNILKQMEFRHPSISNNKPLRYKQIKPASKKE